MKTNRNAILLFIAAFVLGSFLVGSAVFAQYYGTSGPAPTTNMPSTSSGTTGTSGSSTSGTSTTTTPGLPNTGGGGAALYFGN